VAFSGSLLGFVIPLSAAVTNSSSLGDCAVWGLVALVVQIAAYLLLRLPVGNLSGRIAEGQMAAGIWLGAGSLAAGMVNAACMSY
jgi:putative membrane protein